MTKKRITKTHEQAFREKLKRDEDSICPYCGQQSYTGRTETRDIGFIFPNFIYYDKYTCTKCGTEWEVDRD